MGRAIFYFNQKLLITVCVLVRVGALLESFSRLAGAFISQRSTVPSSATFWGNRPAINDDLSSNQEVVQRVLSCSDGSMPIKKAVNELSMNWRKRSIAEAMIMDPTEFQEDT